jgi:hemerythrin-like domain-containing protein
MRRDPSLIPLSHQHQHALALCVVVDRAFAGEAVETAAAAGAQRIVEHFEDEMQGHFGAEEQVLFPVLASLPELAELVPELMAEHQRLRAIVDELRGGPAPPGLVREFTSLLREHVRKEESRLFEAAQQLLSRERLDDIAAQISNYTLKRRQDDYT